MRKLAIAMALASTMLATPSVARDHSGYVGIEGGGMLLENTNFDYSDSDGISLDNRLLVRHDLGYDVDAIAGYDFGMVRAEGELGYKHAGVNGALFGSAFPGLPAAGFEFDANGRTRAISGMGNVLLDFGDDDGWNGFIGLGAGIASVAFRTDVNNFVGTTSYGFSDTDSAFAWQVLAGFRVPVSPNFDVGLKYRFFNVQKLTFSDSFNGTSFDVDARWRSHSLLASLIYNFGAPLPPPPPPPAPPPPPPPPPATQTCPDGSVILATDVCPAPPPPPPPPAPEPVRG